MSKPNTKQDLPTYEDIVAVCKALDVAKVPTENRTMRLSHYAFIELGGTEEAWQKLEKEQN